MKKITALILSFSLVLTLCVGAMPVSAQESYVWQGVYAHIDNDRSGTGTSTFDNIWVGDEIAFTPFSYTNHSGEEGNKIILTLQSGSATLKNPSDGRNPSVVFTQEGVVEVKATSMKASAPTEVYKEKVFTFTVKQRDQEISAKLIGANTYKIGDNSQNVGIQYNGMPYSEIYIPSVIPDGSSIFFNKTYFIANTTKCLVPHEWGAGTKTAQNDHTASHYLPGYDDYNDVTYGRTPFYAPGEMVIQPGYYIDENATPTNATSVGTPFTITVEEPVIKTNAKSTVEVGSSLNLTSELTNVSLQNKTVQSVKDAMLVVPSGAPCSPCLHEIAYQPKIEVIAGNELVTVGGSDFTNTLTASENLVFNGTGTVKVKVTLRFYVSTL